MTPYKEGTITTTVGSNVVVGVDTYWGTQIKIGDKLICAPDKWYVIIEVTDDEHVKLHANVDVALSNITYLIARDSAEWGSNASTAETVTELMRIYKLGLEAPIVEVGKAKQDVISLKSDTELIRDETITAKNTAVSSAGTATQAKTTAIEAKNQAVQAKTGAVTAQGLAEQARNEAETAENSAITAKNETIQAKAETLQSQTTTEEARDVTLIAKEETLTAKDITLQAQATTEKTKADAITEINELTAKSTSDIETAKKVVTDIQADVVIKQTEINQTSATAVTAKNDAVQAKDITLQAKTETVQAKDITLTAKDETLTAKVKVEELLDGIETVLPATTEIAGKVMLATQEDITAANTTKVPTAGAVKQKLDPILSEIEVLKRRTTTGYVDNARKANTAINAEKLNGYTSSYFRCSNACSWTCSSNCTGSCMAGCTACSSCTGSCTSCTNACSQACSSGCSGTCTTSCAGCGGRD
ncbi:MAG: hypothetical protein RR203_02535 [Synergistaceae bacterium]